MRALLVPLLLAVYHTAAAGSETVSTSQNSVTAGSLPTAIHPITSVPSAPQETDLWIDESTPIPGTLNDLAPAADVFIDEHGPFRIGEPVEQTRPDPLIGCANALRELALLDESWPVYRDEQGTLRHQWARDPYRGARRYLDAEARARARGAAEQSESRDCAAARARGAPSMTVRDAQDELLRSALCEAERAELAALEDVIGITEDARARKRALAAEVCGERPVSSP
ncbi:MAG: hypothetical protein ACO3Z6_03100 [Pseudomonadales bacterium]